MFRFVVVSFEILALIMILRSAFVQFWLSDIQTTASQWMNDVSLVLDNKQLSSFRSGIVKHSQNLNEAQIAYILKITSSKSELKHFNQLYCQAGDKNPFIYGINLRYLCVEIDRQEIIKGPNTISS